MSSEKACLEFQNIGMEFPGVKALSDVSFSIGQGEIHALMGANGAGKSTLIKILARVYQQTSGDILLHGQSLSKSTAGNIRDYGIDFIFQELELVPGFTVAQNIMIGIEPRSKAGLIDWTRMTSEAQKALDGFMPGVVWTPQPRFPSCPWPNSRSSVSSVPCTATPRYWFWMSRPAA